MKGAAILVMAVLGSGQVASFAQGQTIVLTEKIARLDGEWVRDRTRGVTSSCRGTSAIDDIVRIRVSAEVVRVESHRLTWLVPLDGRPPTLTGAGSFKGEVIATLDAGWLAITSRQSAPNNRGATNVFREVYIGGDDELTIWRNFTIEWPDGSLSSTVCSYREALVYRTILPGSQSAGQFSMGSCTESITTTSIGPCIAVSLRPSCSRNAVGNSTASGATPGGSLCAKAASR